jgi:endonuclease G
LASPNWCVEKGKKSLWDLTQQGPEPTADELDYCLIRLAERIGEDRLHGSSDPQVDRGGCIAVAPGQQAGQAGQELFLFQHPGGKPLKFTIGDHRGFNGSQNRFYYDINTQKGSSGSPVFNAHLELVGIHNSGWKDASELVKEGRKANQGIPISNIAAKLFERFPQFPMIAA